MRKAAEASREKLLQNARSHKILIKKRLEMSRSSASGNPIRSLAGKWAKTRENLGTSTIVELLDASGRSKAQLSSDSMLFITKSLQRRKMKLHSEKYIAKAIRGLHSQGFNKEVRGLVEVLADKIKGFDQGFGPTGITSIAGLQKLRSCQETDKLLGALIPGVVNADESVTLDDMSSVIYGMQLLNPSEISTRMLRSVETRMQDFPEPMDTAHITASFFGLKRHARTLPGSRILQMLSEELKRVGEEGKRLNPIEASLVLEGVEAYTGKQIGDVDISRTVDKTLAMLAYHLEGQTIPGSLLAGCISSLKKSNKSSAGANKLYKTFASIVENSDLRRQHLNKLFKWTQEPDDLTQLGTSNVAVDASQRDGLEALASAAESRLKETPRERKKLLLDRGKRFMPPMSARR
ncbi:hypothetical protein AAMO2058_000217600 [Amorphochlora amoebiformis]